VRCREQVQQVPGAEPPVSRCEPPRCAEQVRCVEQVRCAEQVQAPCAEQVPGTAQPVR
jgi:hypothetical protein